MEYRFAEEGDQKEIVEVLRASLGEQLMPKTEAFWRWKHEQNPFGKSPVMLALDQKMIVGVRAFLRWTWENDFRRFHALRAVDTSVLPAYQGKGIFSKLTLNLLEECAGLGYDFLFNTPNKISMPGYLKMGWIKFGRIPLKIKVNTTFINKPHCTEDHNFPNPERVFSKLESRYDGMHTLISTEYLKWRYLDCPAIDYHWLSDEETFALVYRIKDGKMGKEMRVVDVFGMQGKGPINKEWLSRILNCRAHQEKVRYISKLDTLNGEFNLEGFGCLPKMEGGPVLTLRDLNLGMEFQNLIRKESWGFSLGDLEVF